jgi:hypothetical protein
MLVALASHALVGELAYYANVTQSQNRLYITRSIDSHQKVCMAIS